MVIVLLLNMAASADPVMRFRVLGSINDAMAPMRVLDSSMSEFPPLREFLLSKRDGYWVTPDERLVPLPKPWDDYTPTMGQLKVQRMLASYERRERLRVVALCSSLFLPWVSPMVEQAAMRTFWEMSESFIELDRAYTTYPALKNFQQR